jgi:hypothetical protein
MGKPVNEKCRECAITGPGRVHRWERPSCWKGAKCSKIRTYYRRIEKDRAD